MARALLMARAPMLRTQRLGWIAITAWALLSARVASAQDDVSERASAALTPPKLVRATQPVYPPAKLTSGENASVALVLTLDETGRVTDVAVATSGGQDFDEAAIAAARDLKFDPAQRDSIWLRLPPMRHVWIGASSR